MYDESEAGKLPSPDADEAELDAKLAGLFQGLRDDLLSFVDRLLRRKPPRLRVRFNPSDVIQESYPVLKRQFRNYLATQRVDAPVWVRRVVINQFKNQCRKHNAKRRSIGKETFLSEDGWGQVPLREAGQSSAPDQQASREESRQRMRFLLHRLPRRYRIVIYLRIFRKMPNQQVARLFGISDSGATNLLVRAQRRLGKAMMESEGPESTP